uniref:G protein-coupled receptor 12 n=1 Tax=Bos mutus grunniens TaxID=30521 RepID=A0A8C0A4V2_BOSMU
MCARTGRLEGGSFERSSEDGSPTRLESCRRGAVPPTPAAVPVPGGRSLAARETHFHVCPQHLSKQTAAVPRVPAPLAHLCASPIPGVPQRQNGIFVVVVMVLSHGDFGFCRISYQRTGVKMNEDPKVNVSGLPPEFVDAGASGNISAEVSSQVPVLQPEPELVVNPWDIVLCTSGTLISCENAIVVLIIFHNPSLRAPMFLLIGSLALADLLAGIGLIVNFVFAYLLQSEATKLVTIGLIVASFSASVCSLLAITVDRYLSLYYALTYHSERTVTFTYVMLFMLWGTSICLGLLPVLGWNCLRDESTCSVVRPLTKNNAAILSVSFLFTFALMLQLYIQICKIVMRHAHQIALQHHFLATSHYVTTRKGISTLAIILGTFAACWMPFTLYSLIADYTYPSIYTYATLLPATYNSIINPVIYAFRNQEIQKALCLVCCGCVPPSLSQRARSPSDV